jgi:hypothetical protein
MGSRSSTWRRASGRWLWRFRSGCRSARAGCGAFRSAAEQPVLATDDEGPDGVLNARGDRFINWDHRPPQVFPARRGWALLADSGQLPTSKSQNITAEVGLHAITAHPSANRHMAIGYGFTCRHRQRSAAASRRIDSGVGCAAAGLLTRCAPLDEKLLRPATTRCCSTDAYSTQSPSTR